MVGRWEKTWYDAVFCGSLNKNSSHAEKAPFYFHEKNSIQSLFGFRFDHFDLVVSFGLADTDAAVCPRIAGLHISLGLYEGYPSPRSSSATFCASSAKLTNPLSLLSADLYCVGIFIVPNCLRRGGSRHCIFHTYRCHSSSLYCQINLNFGLNGAGGRFVWIQTQQVTIMVSGTLYWLISAKACQQITGAKCCQYV